MHITAPTSSLSIASPALHHFCCHWSHQACIAYCRSQTYLDPHNVDRADVGVAPLVWNTTMENYALTYSLSQKPHCLPLTHSRGRYEENLFWGSAGGTWTPHDAVALWVSEKSYYHHRTNTCSPPKGKIVFSIHAGGVRINDGSGLGFCPVCG